MIENQEQYEIKLQNTRDAFDYLFGLKEKSEEIAQTLDDLGLNELSVDTNRNIYDILNIAVAEGISENEVKELIKETFGEKTVFYQDLVKLSFQIYSSQLAPLKKTIDIPSKSGTYKFIVFGKTMNIGKEENLIHFVADTSGYHADIQKSHNESISYEGSELAQAIAQDKKFLEFLKIQEQDVYGGGRIEIDHEKKHLYIYGHSGSFGKLSNTVVKWMLKEYEEKGYTIKTEMGKGY